MKIIYKAPGEEPEVRDVPNTLATLQALVGGYIEVAIFAEDSAIICNEEGRINGMAYNCNFLGTDWYGPIFLVGIDGEEFCDFPGDEECWKGVLKDE